MVHCEIIVVDFVGGSLVVSDLVDGWMISVGEGVFAFSRDATGMARAGDQG